MKICETCANGTMCHVPGALDMFERVLRRLDGERRAFVLQDKLKSYLHRADCLVSSGATHRDVCFSGFEPLS
jgi:hypothetical protein